MGMSLEVTKGNFHLIMGMYPHTVTEEGSTTVYTCNNGVLLGTATKTTRGIMFCISFIADTEVKEVESGCCK